MNDVRVDGGGGGGGEDEDDEHHRKQQEEFQLMNDLVNERLNKIQTKISTIETKLRKMNKEFKGFKSNHKPKAKFRIGDDGVPVEIRDDEIVDDGDDNDQETAFGEMTNELRKVSYDFNALNSSKNPHLNRSDHDLLVKITMDFKAIQIDSLNLKQIFRLGSTEKIHI